MKQKHMTVIAVACGVACAGFVALFMAGVQGEADAARAEALARYGGEQVEVCVATRDIAAGERLDLSAVESKVWVADLLPESAVRASADAVGRTATSPIYKGEVITAGRFDSGLDFLEVPAGKQAVSVPVKAVQAVGGAIRAGMDVDIYASGDSGTSVIARDVKVIDTSVGGSGAFSTSDNGYITLAVEPEAVQGLIAASNRTALYFTLPGEPAGASGEAEGGQGGQGAGVEPALPEEAPSPEAQPPSSEGAPSIEDEAEGGER